jgi:sucrose phosphorylase
MILLGAYPNTFPNDRAGNSISDLNKALTALAPADTPLHLLPFTLSSGDGGFAQDDWFTVSPDLGTWDDIRRMAMSRPLMVDVIYNHVGLKHQYARGFFSGLATAENYLYTYKETGKDIYPDSPRGGSVLREYYVDGAAFKIWQTFSDEAFDINLDSPVVEAEIDRHIELLRSVGIWGARMDAPAYYGKTTGSEHRHNENSLRLARRIADKLVRSGMKITAQLDTDKDGTRYFKKSQGYEIPTIDFSYATNLIYSVLRQDATVLADHVKKTLSLPTQPLRAPRNHDGILLRTPSLSEANKEDLLSFAQENEISPLVHNGVAYELNCSLPYLLGVGMGPSEMQRRVSLTMAITIAVPGWCYLYMPYVLGYQPEIYFKCEENDPRALNRKQIPLSHFEAYLNSAIKNERFGLIEYGQSFKKSIDVCNLEDDYEIDVCDRSVLRIHLKSHNRWFYANLSTRTPARLTIENNARIAFNGGLYGATLNPLGYVFIELPDK